MATLHFVDGGSGAVGKSLVARLLCEHCQTKGFPYVLVEGDLANTDVGYRYPAHVELDADGQEERYMYQVNFIKPTATTDPGLLLEWAIAQPVIVNLPAQGHDQLNHWLTRYKILDFAQAYGVGICRWFVTAGRKEHNELLTQSLKQFEGRGLRHVVVLNRHFRREWTPVRIAAVEAGFSPDEICAIEFPKLRAEELDWVDRTGLSFADALKVRPLPVFSQQRIHTFRKHALQEIEATRLLEAI